MWLSHSKVPLHDPTLGFHPRVLGPGSHPRVSVPLFRYASFDVFNFFMIKMLQFLWITFSIRTEKPWQNMLHEKAIQP